MHSDGSCAMDLVIRNHVGEAIAGKACPPQNGLNAGTYEAITLLKSL
jgi:hypothetical protein